MYFKQDGICMRKSRTYSQVADYMSLLFSIPKSFSYIHTVFFKKQIAWLVHSINGYTVLGVLKINTNNSHRCDISNVAVCYKKN